MTTGHMALLHLTHQALNRISVGVHSTGDFATSKIWVHTSLGPYRDQLEDQGLTKGF